MSVFFFKYDVPLQLLLLSEKKISQKGLLGQAI